MSSLAYYLLQLLLDTEEKYVNDLVIIADIQELIDESTNKINEENNCYVIQSYLKLLDQSFATIIIDEESKPIFKDIIEKLGVLLRSKTDPESALDYRRMWGLFKGLNHKWEKMANLIILDD